MVTALREARQDLGTYEARFHRAIEGAIAEYQRDIGPVAYRHSKRSQASLIHDYMVDAIKEEFADELGVTWKTAQNLFTVDFFHKYRIKLKKHDNRLRTRNHPTQLVLDWLDQKQLELPHMPAAVTNLHLGYQPGLTLGQSRIWLTCPDGSSLAWSWELAGSEPMALPRADPVKPAPVRPRIAPAAAVPQVNTGTATDTLE